MAAARGTPCTAASAAGWRAGQEGSWTQLGAGALGLALLWISARDGLLGGHTLRVCEPDTSMLKMLLFASCGDPLPVYLLCTMYYQPILLPQGGGRLAMACECPVSQFLGCVVREWQCEECAYACAI